jgi:NitT/TauT family transport system permease protein
LLPSPWKVCKAFFGALQDEDVLSNLFLTLHRVMTGFGIAVLIGGFLGVMMAKFKIVMQAIDPILNPLRQVPVMAWVPLAIIWFGLGEGPTLFLITLVAVFPIMLCTVSGIQGIDKDYYNSALSMGSSRFSLFYKITVPAAMPELLTGMRAGLSAGWMSVI